MACNFAFLASAVADHAEVVPVSPLLVLAARAAGNGRCTAVFPVRGVGTTLPMEPPETEAVLLGRLFMKIVALGGMMRCGRECENELQRTFDENGCSKIKLKLFDRFLWLWVEMSVRIKTQILIKIILSLS